jgi:methyl-accepting chemotaxis protein
LRRELFVQLLVSFIALLGLTSLLVDYAMDYQYFVVAGALVIAAAVLAAVTLAQIATAHLNKVDRFARHLADGHLDARVDDPGFSVSADTTRKLDQGMARLEEAFHGLEGRRRAGARALDERGDAACGAADRQSRTGWALSGADTSRSSGVGLRGTGNCEPDCSDRPCNFDCARSHI